MALSQVVVFISVASVLSQLGSATNTGVGPVFGAKNADEAPWGLALSGNGYRAEAAGAGILKALYASKWLKELTSISSISGGSWFSTQFAFSETYYVNTVSKSTNISTWYTDYEGYSIAGLFEAFSKCSNCWEDIIQAMYKTVPGFDTNAPAIPKNRVGNKYADLLIGTTLANQGTMSDGSTVTLNANGTPVSGVELPAFWAIPADTSAPPSWNIPAHDVSELEVTSGERSAPLVLPVPSVGAISAMTSAANGAAGAPGLRAACEAANPPGADFCSVFPCEGDHLASNAICSDAPPGDADACAFPAVRLLDGCYADNLGLALNIGYLQKKHPGRTLRMLALTANGCDRAADPTCVASARETALRSYFKDGPYPTTSGWLPYVVPAVDRRIFAEAVTDEDVLGTPVGGGGQTVMTGTFTTVENKAFGVAAGTTVRLVSILTNGGEIQPQTPEQMAALGAMAADLQGVTAEIVSNLTLAGCVSSAGDCPGITIADV